MASDNPGFRRIDRALLSVADKTGVADLARRLLESGIELWATSGTRTTLEKSGLTARSLEELTGVDAWFGGRVKTLHPAVFGGVLAPRSPEGLAELGERGLVPFDLVVVNFYPFERHLIDAPGATDREEFIDVGGVSLARAAAKNHASVAVLTEPGQYAGFIHELGQHRGAVGPETRLRLAVRAFERCAQYDEAIARGLAPAGRPPEEFPEVIRFRRDPLALRYGENPHQRAAAYVVDGDASGGLAPFALSVLKGDTPSYTNLLDLDTAVGIVAEFTDPAVAVVKHATPCGVATAATVRDAFVAAVATDPVARYGCTVASNRPIGPDDPGSLKGVFVDLLAAPEFDPAALESLGSRPKIKLLRIDPVASHRATWEARTVLGRLLVQESDQRPLLPSELRRVAGPEPASETLGAVQFAWKVVRHAKSNAIVLARGTATLGIGSGQPTRVKAVEIACEVAGTRAAGSILASDAFFPFSDGVDVAGRAGVKVIVQPGGSIRDPEVIAAAERHGITMYFTGWRVFRH